ncbi:MAG: hypothetical protein Q4C54_00485, partial [Clostridia bacterium]|nr:hypothetical protein [Clostridia bacterium]
IIQTYKPEDPIILTAAKQDYRTFFEEEFARRKRGLYPPFSIMARLLVESVNAQAAENCCRQLYNRVKALLERHPLWQKRVLLLSADQAPVKILRGKARYNVLMKLLVHPETEALVAAVTGLAR